MNVKNLSATPSGRVHPLLALDAGRKGFEKFIELATSTFPSEGEQPSGAQEVLRDVRIPLIIEIPKFSRIDF